MLPEKSSFAFPSLLFECLIDEKKTPCSSLDICHYTCGFCISVLYLGWKPPYFRAQDFLIWSMEGRLQFQFASDQCGFKNFGKASVPRKSNVLLQREKVKMCVSNSWCCAFCCIWPFGSGICILLILSLCGHFILAQPCICFSSTPCSCCCCHSWAYFLWCLQDGAFFMDFVRSPRTASTFYSQVSLGWVVVISGFWIEVMDSICVLSLPHWEAVLVSRYSHWEWDVQHWQEKWQMQPFFSTTECAVFWMFMCPVSLSFAVLSCQLLKLPFFFFFQ